ncbi:class I SAM-dependent methyltransferase [Fodinicurvata fenggangensis]|uniref:class I SAM-dependent methyltransferase n=1 Tax=Fodinicurvata fenggangensis TaxID=1121830 RepID=UPI00068F049A|nr:class I SAM-dependent methyltransferase [Fodinicurvata fenggangensis]
MSKALLDSLVRRIRSQGPITVADYMSEALSHPQHGYYQTQDPFGRAGDFITAPEISQMFGELIGLWCADTWQAQGSPPSCALVELGPGRGTLMSDILRAARTLPGFEQTLEVHLVETSPALRRLQQENLAGRTEPTWHEDLENLPQRPTFFLANEFFDALPVHQYQRSETGWHERLVGLSDDGQNLAFGLSGALPDSLCNDLPECSPGDVVTVCPAARSYAAIMAKHISQYGGAALCIDYGHDHTAAGDTLQAVKQHKYHPVLQDPGDADLTAHVDFAALCNAAKSAGAQTHGPVGQGAFLKALGIETRAALLGESATPDQRAAIAAALQRLTESEQMGTLFRVMAITAAQAPTPAGFPVTEADCTEGRASG